MTTNDMAKLRSAQEIYTTVRRHLLTQMEKSLEPDTGRCLYRGPRGLKCAIGALIADEDYTPTLETKGARSYHVAHAARVSVDHRELAARLQSIHDNITTDLWVERLDDVAVKFGLKVED